MIDKLRWFVEHFEEVMGALILALMTLLAFLNVLTRYLIRYSFAPSEEIEVNALVWITMFGSAAAFKRGSHLKLIFLNRYVGESFSRIFWLLGRVLAVGVFSLLIYHDGGRAGRGGAHSLTVDLPADPLRAQLTRFDGGAWWDLETMSGM